jgi:hypothetical protein
MSDEGRPVKPHRSGGGHWVGPTREEPSMDELIANVTAPYVWLIERGQPEQQSPPIWWRGKEQSGVPYMGLWTETAHEAMSFPTKNAADSFIASHYMRLCRATEHIFLDRSTPSAAMTAPAPLPEERTVSVRELVRLLEGSAGNTDTDWRWQAATALRKCPHWETLKLILRSDG